MKYYGHHIPSGEDWLILGVDEKGRVCAAGWPPTIGKLSDIEGLELCGERTQEEEEYVIKHFGKSFLNQGIWI